MLLFETVKNLIFWIVTRVSTRDYTVIALKLKALDLLLNQSLLGIFVFYTQKTPIKESFPLKPTLEGNSAKVFFSTRKIIMPRIISKRQLQGFIFCWSRYVDIGISLRLATVNHSQHYRQATKKWPRRQNMNNLK